MKIEEKTINEEECENTVENIVNNSEMVIEEENILEETFYNNNEEQIFIKESLE